MEKTNNENPISLVESWINEKSTTETHDESKEKTTLEKEKIRQARLEYFLPYMEKEFPEFKRRIKYTWFARRTKDIDITLFIIWYIILYTLAHLTFYDWGMFSEFIAKIVPKDHPAEIILYLAQILEFLSPVLLFGVFVDLFKVIPLIKIRRKITFPSKDELARYTSEQFPYENAPYIEAFMLANGFAKIKDNNILSSNKSWLIAPTKIKDMNFNEFIDFVKTHYEPLFLDYDSKDYSNIITIDTRRTIIPTYNVFNCIFFYQNQNTLKEHAEYRGKLASAIQTEYLSKHPRERSRMPSTNKNSNYRNKPVYQSSFEKKKTQAPPKTTIEDCMRESVEMELARKILDID